MKNKADNEVRFKVVFSHPLLNKVNDGMTNVGYGIKKVTVPITEYWCWKKSSKIDKKYIEAMKSSIKEVLLQNAREVISITYENQGRQ